MTFYKIVRGGMGGALCPPGHPQHTHSIQTYESSRDRVPFGSMALEGVFREKSPDYVRQIVRKMLDNATLVYSEAWQRQVYMHFRHCYILGETDDWTSQDVTIHNIPDMVAARVRTSLQSVFDDPDIRASLPVDARSYRNGSPYLGRRRGYEVTAEPDGTTAYVYALTDDGTRYGSLPILDAYTDALHDSGYPDACVTGPFTTDAGDLIPERVVLGVPDAPAPLPVERHAGYLTVRHFFPEHTPRLDLIADPGVKGNAPCLKCGRQVQYSPRLDRLAVYGAKDGDVCTAGDMHTWE